MKITPASFSNSFADHILTIKRSQDLAKRGDRKHFWCDCDASHVRRNNFGMQHWMPVHIVWLHCPLDLWRRATCVVATMVGPLTMLLGLNKKRGFSVDEMEREWCSTYYVYILWFRIGWLEVVVVTDEKTAMDYKKRRVFCQPWIRFFFILNHDIFVVFPKPFLRAFIKGLCGLMVRVGLVLPCR